MAGIATLHIQVSALVTGGFLLLELLALAVQTVLGVRHAHLLLSILLHPLVAAPSARLAALHGRRTGACGRTTWRMHIFPAPPLLGLLFLLAVAALDLFDPAGRIGLLITALTTGASLLIFPR